VLGNKSGAANNVGIRRIPIYLLKGFQELLVGQLHPVIAPRQVNWVSASFPLDAFLKTRIEARRKGHHHLAPGFS